MSTSSRMHGQMVRFGRAQWQLIQEEAAVEGVSASQYVRDAAWTRAVIARARRGEGISFEELARAIDALVRAGALDKPGMSTQALLTDLKDHHGGEESQDGSDGTSPAPDEPPGRGRRRRR